MTKRRPSRCHAAKARPSPDPIAYFAGMVDLCLAHAEAARKQGRPIVGILCEFTPRELIMAAGGVPVCLCGGDVEMIAPAEEILPANLCPLIKSTFGYHRTGANTFLEMADLVVAETTCDGKKKMYELMAQSRTMYVLELSQKPDDPDALAHWTAELRKLRSFLQARYGRRITDARLLQSIRLMNQYRLLRRQLAELMARPDPPITGRQLLDMKSLIWGLPEDMAQYELALAAWSGRPGRADLKDRVRVLLTGVPTVHGAEKVIDIIEASGGLVVCMENCTGLKPLLQDVDESAADPIEAIAAKYLAIPCSVMTRNDRRLDSLRALCKQYRPQCIVDLSWQACLTYDIESARVKQLADETLRLPYLRISTDYSPSDSPRIALRVQALLETVQSRRGRKTPS